MEIQSSVGPYSEFRKGWPVVLAAAIGVGAGVTGTTVYSLSVFLNPLAEEFGWSRTALSGAKAFLNLGMVVTAPIVGYYADRIGVRKMALWSLAAMAAVMAAMTLVNGNIATYYFGLFLTAVAGCATTPLVWTRGVATWFVKKRGLALGLTVTGSGIAGILTPSFLGALIDRYSWRGGYVGLGVIALLATIPIFFLFYEKEERHSPIQVTERPQYPGLELQQIVSSTRFWQIVVAFFMIGAVISALGVHLVPLLTEPKVGFRRDTALQIAGVLGLAVTFGRLAAGYLVDRFHPPYVAAISISLPIIGLLIVASGAPSSWAVIVAVATFGIAGGSEVDLIPYLTARYFGLKSYGKAYGWIFVVFYSGVGLGPLLLGASYDRFGSYDAGLYAAIPLLGIGALILAMLGRPPTFESEAKTDA